MDWDSLKTMKEVADILGEPAHRIIHVCEMNIVRPALDAAGRGSVRRFNRENVFRIALALHLQDAGTNLSLIKKLMGKLDRLMEIREIKNLREQSDHFDLVSIIRHFSSTESEKGKQVLAWLTPPDRVTLVIPRLNVPSRPDIHGEISNSLGALAYGGVSIVANLTWISSGL